jgi:hypothetical protein
LFPSMRSPLITADPPPLPGRSTDIIPLVVTGVLVAIRPVVLVIPIVVTLPVPGPVDQWGSPVIELI